MKGFLACCLAVLPEMVKANLKRPIYFTAKQCTCQYLVCMIAPITASGRTNKPNNKQFLYMQSIPAIAGLDSTVVQ